eukprot:jgi/Botrbrau1/10853/Bobra.0025s0031.1
MLRWFPSSRISPWLFVLICLKRCSCDLVKNDIQSLRSAEYISSTSLPWSLRSGGLHFDYEPLELCECEPATADNGLNCRKEGWFVAGFEDEARFAPWGFPTGPHLPLAHAICCRLCLPKKLPNSTGLPPESAEVRALLNIACHEASGNGGPEMCDSGWGSLVTGWFDSADVVTSSGKLVYYPQGSPQCCTPALLLASGDVLELEKCSCQPMDNGTSCGHPMTSHRLLQGFTNSQVGLRGPLVPMEPATCCRMCLGSRVHPLDDCAYLDDCTGNGFCVDSVCECYRGWGGPTCSEREDNAQKWFLSLLVFCACAVSLIFMSFGARVARYVRDHWSDEQSEAGEQLQEAFIIRVEDDNGSVGSEDTTDCESEVEEDLHVPADEATQDGEESNGSVRDPGEEWPEGLGVDDDGSEEQQPTASPNSYPNSEIEAAAEAPLLQEGREGSEAGSQQDDGPEKEDADTGKASKSCDYLRDDTGVQGVDCSVCMCRAVQVVVIPCGHACMCRRCSRRIVRCPICRKEILRRQRLFIGG